MPFQEGCVAERTGGLVETKMLFLNMSPCVGLHGELGVTNGTNESTFSPDNKVLDA